MAQKFNTSVSELQSLTIFLILIIYRLDKKY
nr:hypothetical protein [Staphylococcus sp. AntiMn-1]